MPDAWAARNCCDQRIYLPRADDLQFDVITSFRRAQQDER
jgi:hypothetical protein